MSNSTIDEERFIIEIERELPKKKYTLKNIKIMYKLNKLKKTTCV